MEWRTTLIRWCTMHNSLPIYFLFNSLNVRISFFIAYSNKKLHFSSLPNISHLYFTVGTTQHAQLFFSSIHKYKVYHIKWFLRDVRNAGRQCIIEYYKQMQDGCTFLKMFKQLKSICSFLFVSVCWIIVELG